MGSVIDLNLSPDPASATTTATVLPKLEPKLEPLDESDQCHLLSPGDEFFPGARPSPIADSAAPAPIASDEGDVYSEFYRISELFRSAFGNRMQSGGGWRSVDDVVELDSNSGAIVPVVSPEEEILNGVHGGGEISTAVAISEVTAPHQRYDQRSSELVRVSDLCADDRRHFRGVVRRTRMLYESLRIFDLEEVEKRGGLGNGKRARSDLRAASILRSRSMWLNRDKRIVGAIPGVYIGDVFFFRAELCVVGLHGQPQAGIDYVPASQSSNGEPIATSIIVSGGYEDDEDAGDVIIYTGQGGQDKFSRQCFHQKLQGGNLALERSMHYGIELRVIRGFKYEGSVSGKVYVYDGLYRILESWFDVGKSGFGVYKYKLLRIEGQPEMGSSILRFAQSLRSKPLSVRPTGYLSLDISMKKETVPVFLYNDIDNDHEPMFYEYLVKTVFPPFAYHSSGGNASGCGCVSFCSTEGCFCAKKNGGEFPYDNNGILLKGKPLIFECGKFCRCPPSCRNRVTQHGVRNRLEVFRSRETGWGVRSLDLIQAGAFICEYAGVVLTMDQVSVFTMNGDSLVYPSRFSDKWAEWGDLSQVYSGYLRPSHPSTPPLDFAMDVSKLRNVASYISHSSIPNVLVQSVVYDHNNILFPHLMIFALENIPPLRDLSLDYGMADETSGKLRICN